MSANNIKDWIKMTTQTKKKMDSIILQAYLDTSQSIQPSNAEDVISTSLIAILAIVLKWIVNNLRDKFFSKLDELVNNHTDLSSTELSEIHHIIDHLKNLGLTHLIKFLLHLRRARHDEIKRLKDDSQ